VVVKNGLGYWWEGQFQSAGYFHFNSGDNGFVLAFWSQKNMPCIRQRGLMDYPSATADELDEMYWRGDLFYEEMPEEEQSRAPVFLW
jgi:hypothetical protein